MENLHGRVTVITGGASGLGPGLARGFAGAGMRPVRGAPPGEKLDGAAAALRDAGHGARPHNQHILQTFYTTHARV